MTTHPSPPSSMPITPAHEQLIESVLQLVFARFNELAVALGIEPAHTIVTQEQVQAATLAKELRILVRYAEGYNMGDGDIMGNIRVVGRILYPKPMARKGFQFPSHFHTTPVGELVHTALVRAYPRETRMGVGEVTKLLGVSRQTVHGWAEDAILTPIYEKGQLTFTRKQVEHFHQQRQEKLFLGASGDT